MNDCVRLFNVSSFPRLLYWIGKINGWKSHIHITPCSTLAMIKNISQYYFINPKYNFTVYYKRRSDE